MLGTGVTMLIGLLGRTDATTDRALQQEAGERTILPLKYWGRTIGPSRIPRQAAAPNG